ncbi:creatininase family protein [Acidisoma silvae]|uniref:Creatininase family protein n=1 Tax=Acidisoma silvae TaxID=2802396 RepID=A0A963YXW3_9PROT|nr:creatininase family protein [Acidisoma silvae]MCB8878198.1 creatininase family protein [Acidisoma silvae]
MRIGEMNWMQVESYLQVDDRCVLPLGSTEQHAYLSLSVDSILSERVAAEAAEPLGVPVFPALSYGLTPYFKDFPGTISLRMETYLHILQDMLDSVYRSGFRRILLCNGHGGNAPAGAFAMEWMADHPDASVRFHNWWSAPKTWAAVQVTDKVASHASWMENFPWTRLAHVTAPEVQKPMTDLELLRLQNPAGVRRMLGDGNYGGFYQRDDAEMLAIWSVAVAETRALLEGPWA